MHTITAALLFYQHYIDLYTANTVAADFTKTRVQTSLDKYKSSLTLFALFQASHQTVYCITKKISPSVTFFANGYTSTPAHLPDPPF